MEVRSHVYSTPCFKRIPEDSRSDLPEPRRRDGFYDFTGNIMERGLITVTIPP